MNQFEAFVQAVNGLANEQNKLLVVTGKPGSGKSKVLREAADVKGWDYVDCRLLITEEFLELLPAQRQERAPELIMEILSGCNSEVIMLDRVQTFFVPVFHIDVADLFKKLGERFTVVVAWPGHLADGILCYDKFDGTESIRIPADDIKIWNVE